MSEDRNRVGSACWYRSGRKQEWKQVDCVCGRQIMLSMRLDQDHIQSLSLRMIRRGCANSLKLPTSALRRFRRFNQSNATFPVAARGPE